MAATMREMKDSGIEYIGLVPADWKIKRLKYVLSERNYRSETGSEMLLSISQYLGVVPSDTIQRTMQANSLVGYKKVYPTDLVFNKLNPVLARFGVSGYVGITSPDFAVYYTDVADTRFLCYLLKTDSYITEYGRICTGVGEGFSRLYTPMLYNISVALPLHSQQVRIADFLDSKCAEIDALSADIQSEIDTLEAYKRSVITEAVTKGLDNTVPMKDSGTQWLGYIPAHWNISRIGSVYDLRNTKVSDKDYEPLSVTMKGIVPQLDTAAKTNAHDDRKLVRRGDFVINSRSDRRGSCGISPLDGSVSLINTVLSPLDEMNPEYYDWLFHTTEFADEFYKWGHGIVDDLWTTGWQDMKKILIPYPSLQEQEKIAKYLNGKCSEIDAILYEKQEQLTVLAEYKKSIIYEYVTGKKEVPND